MTDEAIGEVTVAIRNLLLQGMPTYQVTLFPPWENFGTDNGVNLFLYKIIENPQWKNMEWPRNPSYPTGISRPPLSLDLFYLLTPYAKKETETDGVVDTALNHKILGKAMQILNENPVLNDIHNNYFDADDSGDLPGNLRDSFEKIKITLLPLDMDEMSKIWSMGEKDYKLSVAYHVSLVQLMPAIEAGPAAALVQQTGLKVTTLAPPVIIKLNPGTGPVGTDLHIRGMGLWLKGLRTVVKVGETLITDFVSATENEIVLTIPGNLKQGPDQEIIVAIDGRESKPAVFHVSPWIGNIKPLRGAVKQGNPLAVPLEIHGHGLQGIVQISIGGVIIASQDITVVNDNLIKTYMPDTLANGRHDIDLQVDGNDANIRSFEVIPLIESIAPAAGPVGTAINITGQRLNGNYVRIHVGHSVITKETQPGSTLISFNVPKALSPGEYEVKVEVDGHTSNIETFEVTG